MSTSLATQRLKAVSSMTRQLLLRLISSDTDINIQKINSHIRIDQGALMHHIQILKDSELINNHSWEEDGQKRTVYNIRAEGKQYLHELGLE